jgi:hypothetical protein
MRDYVAHLSDAWQPLPPLPRARLDLGSASDPARTAALFRARTGAHEKAMGMIE